jgi:Rrf2 family nitric oxide-sensitive transcriptional repressor
LLGREGLLVTTRGKGGGLALARRPSTISVGAVVRLTEGAPVPAECFDRERNACVISPLCKLRGVLGDAVKAFYAVLDGYTLEDLVRNRHALAKVLLVESAAALQSN